VAGVLAAAQRRPPTGDPIEYLHATAHDRGAANLDAQMISERWDGGGGPIGLRHDAIPPASRILAVAEAWSALTAHGSQQLGHHEALAHLQADAGARLDPAVVRAARAVIAQERVTATEPAPEPRLHRLRVPAPLRRAIASAS
jgi:hypothetical protein